MNMRMQRRLRKKINALIIIIMAFMIFSAYNYSSKAEVKSCLERENETNDWICEKGSDFRNCYYNCQDLGMRFFMYDISGFGSAECWCQLENETKQIY